MSMILVNAEDNAMPLQFLLSFSDAFPSLPIGIITELNRTMSYNV